MASRRRARKVSARRSVAGAPVRPGAARLSALREWCAAMEQAAQQFADGLAALASAAMDIAEANKAREAGRLH